MVALIINPDSPDLTGTCLLTTILPIFCKLFAGWAICDNDVIAISRLIGPRLKKLDIPHCCILTIGEPDEDWAFGLGITDDQFNEEVSHIFTLNINKATVT